MPFKNPHPLYGVWQGMLNRCRNPKSRAWKDYGARGIGVCNRWRSSFLAFVADMGPRPSGHTLERRDNDGNYEPGNCHWSTRKDQSRNRRVTLFVEADSRKHIVAELAEKSGLKPDTIIRRAEKFSTLTEILAPERYVFRDGLRLGGLANGKRQRAKTHCKHGHEFSPENTLATKNGGRACRKCHANRQRTRNAAQYRIASEA